MRKTLAIYPSSQAFSSHLPSRPRALECAEMLEGGSLASGVGLPHQGMLLVPKFPVALRIRHTWCDKEGRGERESSPLAAIAIVKKSSIIVI